MQNYIQNEPKEKGISNTSREMSNHTALMNKRVKEKKHNYKIKNTNYRER